MGGTYNSGSSSINGDITIANASSIALPATGQTLMHVAVAADASEQTLATITAGKVGYVVWFGVSGTANGYTSLKNNAGTTTMLLRHLANDSVNSGWGVFGKYTAGQAIKCQGGAATTFISLVYVEVDA